MLSLQWTVAVFCIGLLISLNVLSKKYSIIYIQRSMSLPASTRQVKTVLPPSKKLKGFPKNENDFIK